MSKNLNPSPSSSKISAPYTFATESHPVVHYHRIWHRECLHRSNPVKVPVINSPDGNFGIFCMCDSPDEYYWEVVNREDVEMVVVDEIFLEMLEERKKKEGLKGEIKSMIKGIGFGDKNKKLGEVWEGRKVVRWVPRMRRVEGKCSSCSKGKGKETSRVI